MRPIFITIFCLGVLAASSALESSDLLVAPSHSLLAGEWTRIEPGGDTRCAHDTPYAFWVRPGTVNRLLVYFQGGGACWDAATCAPGSGYYDDAVTTDDSPEYSSGIFNLDNPGNPFKDYTMVYTPLCTGDVHWGNHVQTYNRDGDQELTIYHKGFVNGIAALEWGYAHVTAPESVFVTGSSSGSVGSAAFAPYIIQHYAQSQVSQLGDSLAFVFHRPLDLQTNWRAHDNFPDWIPALANIDPGQFRMADYYVAIANYYPAQLFAQYNTAHDATQLAFYLAVGGQPEGFEPDFEASLDLIHTRASNFRAYTASDSTHSILPFDSFYTQQTEGVPFRVWIAGLANGRLVDNVHCVNCETVEVGAESGGESGNTVGNMIEPGDQIGDMVVTTGQPGDPEIWNFCDPYLAGPGIYTRECELPAIPNLQIGSGNLADTAELQNLEWQAQTWELTLDDQPINLSAFGTLPDQNILEGGRALTLRQWNVVLDNPIPGQHTLRYVIREHQLGSEDSVTDATWIFTVVEQ
jgi:hypothetical protein